MRDDGINKVQRAANQNIARKINGAGATNAGGEANQNTPVQQKKSVQEVDEDENLDDVDFELTSHNLVRLSSTGGEARRKVKNFVESMINDKDDDDDEDLPDMNQVPIYFSLFWFLHCFCNLKFLVYWDAA